MSLFKRKAKDAVTPQPAVGNDEAWQKVFGNGYVLSSVAALKVAAVFRCVDIISKTMASLPLNLFINTSEGAEKATESPLYNLMYVLPNEWTTRYEFIQMGVANLLLTKGMYVKIKRDSRGRIASLWNIPTKNVSNERITETGRHIDVYDDVTHVTETLNEGEFMYIPSFRFSDPHSSEDPMVIAASVLGLIDSADTYSAMALNGANPGGFVTYPGQMSDTSYERFKSSFQENYSGAANAGKWMFLEEGAKAEQFERDMEKNQVLETRKWAVTEVCRIFGVPPHMCMDMEHATFSNIEQQSLEFVRDCIEPLCVRLEQAFYKDLLSSVQKRSMFFKFNLNGLLRADTATRAQYYHNARQDGWMSANDIRALEDMNGIGPDGDIYAVNGNLIPLSEVPNNKPKGSRNQ